MSIPSRVAPALRSLQRAVPASARPFTSTIANRKEEWPQRFPIGKFYESILDTPTPYPFDQKPEEPPNSADPKVLPEEKEPVPVKKPEPTKTEEKRPEPTKTEEKKAEPTKTEEKAPEEKEKKTKKSGERPAKKKPGRKPKNSTVTTTSSPPPSASTSPPTPAPPPSTPEEKARIIFGTRLASPDDKEARLALKANSSTYVAGVTIPPEPAEPDNCCMSGCVNCVWDVFREDMEEFTAKKKEAQQRLQAQSGSMDADGGGSGTNLASKGKEVGETKIAKDMWDDDVFANVPVGIREFMKQEKRLKEKHEREGTVG